MARKDLSQILGTKESEVSSYQEGAKGLKGVAKGAIKGLASTMEGGSRLFGSAVAKGFDVIGMDKTAESMRGDFAEGKEFAETELRPEGAAEKIGYGVEQFAEFFAPMGLATKATKAIKGAEILKALPKGYRTAATLLGISGVEGMSFAAVTAAQEGEFNKEVRNSFLFGAAFPLATTGGGAALKGIAKSKSAQVIAAAAAKPIKQFNEFLSERVSSKLINTIMRPQTKDFVFSKADPGKLLRDPGRAVVKEGIVANSRMQLAEKMFTKLDDIGVEIGSKLKQVKGQVDLKRLLPTIDDEIAKVNTVGGQKGLLDELLGLRKSITHNLSVVDGKGVYSTARKLKYGAEDAHKIKRLLGEQTKWHGVPYEKAANQVRVKLYRNLNDLIDEAAEGSGVKGIKALQERYGELLTAKNAMERTIKSQADNRIVGLTDVMTLLGSGAGALANPAFLAAYPAKKAAESTFVRTRAAQVLSKTPKYMKGLGQRLQSSGYASSKNIEKTIRAMFVGMSRMPSQK